MNHCIRGRVLQPVNAQQYHGVVVTSPLKGQIVHYVFRDKDSRLFTMGYELFQCRTPGLKKTEQIRREQFLKFGDNITFTTDNRNRILDFEKGIAVFECSFSTDGQQLLKTICCLPPPSEEQFYGKLWTQHFGLFELTEEEKNYLYEHAAYDVPIFSWIGFQIDYDNSIMYPYFSRFDSIAVESDRHFAWDADWNVSRKPTSKYTWEQSDSDSDGDKYITKTDEQVYDVHTKLEGVLIGQKEIFCSKLKDHRVYIGLWEPGYTPSWDPPPVGPDGTAPDKADLQLFGRLLIFDAFYSDVRQEYIAYFHKFDDDPLGDVRVDLPRWNAEPTLTVSLNFNDCQGSLYNNTHFGLIANPHDVLRCLPYNYEMFMDQDTVDVVIKDRGPEHLVRFEISYDLVPAKTRQYVNQALETAKEESEGIGFVVDHNARRLFSPQFPTIYFNFPEECPMDIYPVGYFVDFKWCYHAETNYHWVMEARRNKERPPVPHSRQRKERPTGSGFEFKIEVDYEKIDAKRYLLLNEHFGYVSDPDKRFQAKAGLKKYIVIVEEDLLDYAELGSLFKIVRMAKPKEKMESDMPGGLAAADARAAAEPEEEDFDLGCDDEDAFEDQYSKQRPSQVEFNSEHAIRTRKKEADKRRKERRKLEKAMKEQEQKNAIQNILDIQNALEESEMGTEAGDELESEFDASCSVSEQYSEANTFRMR